MTVTPVTCCLRTMLPALLLLLQVQPVPADVDDSLHKWTDRTPAMAAIKGATVDKAAAAADKDKKGSKDGKKAAAGKKKKK